MQYVYKIRSGGEESVQKREKDEVGGSAIKRPYILMMKEICGQDVRYVKTHERIET